MQRTIYWIGLLGITSTLLLLISFALAAGNSDFHRWHVQRIDKTLIYSPPNLQRGETFQISQYPVAEISDHSHQQWFKYFVSRDAARLGKITKSIGPTEDKRGVWTAGRRFTTKRGIDRQVIYISPALGDNRAGMLRIVFSSQAVLDRFRYGINEAASILAGKQSAAPVAPSKNNARRKGAAKKDGQRSRPTFDKQPLNVHITKLIYYGVIDFGINGADANYVVIALVADGRCTKDVNGLYRLGVAASRRQKPDDWGSCRIRDGRLEVRWNGETAFETVDGFYRELKPRPTDERLKGCWSNTSGHTNASGTTSLAVDDWCFDRSGRFSQGRTLGIQSGNATGHGQHDKTGWYRIDGHAIRLAYDDGKKVIKTIGLDQDGEDAQNELILGNEVYFLQ